MKNLELLTVIAIFIIINFVKVSVKVSIITIAITHSLIQINLQIFLLLKNNLKYKIYLRSYQFNHWKLECKKLKCIYNLFFRKISMKKKIYFSVNLNKN